MRQGKTDAEIAKFSKLFTEVQQQIDSKQLRPMIRTQYLRTAFQVRLMSGCLGFEQCRLDARAPGIQSCFCTPVCACVLHRPIIADMSGCMHTFPLLLARYDTKCTSEAQQAHFVLVSMPCEVFLRAWGV